MRCNCLASEDMANYRRVQGETWRKYLEERLVHWSPSGWLRHCMDKLSRRRIVRLSEWNMLAAQLAKDHCPWGRGPVMRALQIWDPDVIGIWRGRALYLPRVDMDELLRTARREKRQFCDVAARHVLEGDRIRRKERDLEDVADLIRHLNRARRNGRQRLRNNPRLERVAG